MKLLSRIVLALAVLTLVTSFFEVSGAAAQNFYMKDITLTPVKTGRGNKDSTWVWLKGLGANIPSTASSDTFYFDLADWAGHHPAYSLQRRGSFLADSAYSIGASRTGTAIRDSMFAFSVGIVVDGTYADADSVNFTLASNSFGNLTKAFGFNNPVPYANTWATTAQSFAGATSYFATFSTTGDFSFFAPIPVTNGTAFVANTTLSRTCLTRGIRMFRLIVKGNFQQLDTRVKYVARVRYLAQLPEDTPPRTGSWN